jgi:phosphohistidine phosphatase
MLLRHAKSEWPDDVADPERPLARRGRKDAPAAGRWLRATGQVPDLVVCSPARRARETWELVQDALGGHPTVVFDERIYGASAATLLELARQTGPGTGTVLIVGHEPAMRELTLALAAEQPEGQGDDQIAPVRAKFPTASIAVLEFTGSWAHLRPGQARLAAFARPSDFRSGAGQGT